MLAGAEAAGLGLRGDVLVTAVCDEEVGSIGTEALVVSVRADAAIVAEPTDERVAVAHRQEYSSYPARCLLTGERRTIPGESVDGVRAEIEALAAGIDASVEVPIWREPFETQPEEEVVQALLAATGAEEVAGVGFWADSALLGGAGIPTVVFGPVTGGLHGEDEWVDLASLERCRAAYVDVARRICA